MLSSEPTHDHTTKASVGIFCPPASGKRFFLAPLLVGPSHRVLTTLDDQEYDCGDEIFCYQGPPDPHAVPIRFTSLPLMPPPKGFPVRVRLLQQTEILRLLQGKWYTLQGQVHGPRRLKKSELTLFYDTLLLTLEELDHTKNIFCPVHAILPSEYSIINTAAYLNPEHLPPDAPITMLTQEGKCVNVLRSTLAALATEITLPIVPPCETLLMHRDIVDFPEFPTSTPHDVLDTKVVTPMDVRRYHSIAKKYLCYAMYASLQTTSLDGVILSLGRGKPAATGLLPILHQWVEARQLHDAMDSNTTSPKKQPKMLVVFTRAGADLEGRSSALTANISMGLEYIAPILAQLARQGNETAAQNIHFLRNPHMCMPRLFTYTSEGQEQDHTTEGREACAAMRIQFLQEPVIMRYIPHPAHAWERLMGINDGGMGYFLEQAQTILQ